MTGFFRVAWLVVRKDLMVEARSLEIVGPACVAGREAAVPMRAQIAREGRLLELDVIDVAAFDAQGRLTRMRAFFDLAGARPLG